MKHLDDTQCLSLSRTVSKILRSVPGLGMHCIKPGFPFGAGRLGGEETVRAQVLEALLPGHPRNIRRR